MNLPRIAACEERADTVSLDEPLVRSTIEKQIESIDKFDISDIHTSVDCRLVKCSRWAEVSRFGAFVKLTFDLSHQIKRVTMLFILLISYRVLLLL
jgi:hypothetical protein